MHIDYLCQHTTHNVKQGRENNLEKKVYRDKTSGRSSHISALKAGCSFSEDNRCLLIDFASSRGQMTIPTL